MVKLGRWSGIALLVIAALLMALTVAPALSAELTGPDDPMKGYVRSSYCTWASAGKGMDTRGKILVATSEVPVQITGGVVRSGRWTDFYDGTALASLPQVDHLVPIGEAYRSGGRDWPKEKRQAFCNDPDNLVVTSSRLNQSKGDRDPTKWLPPEAARCKFIERWALIKAKYGLRSDPAEVKVVTKLAAACRP